MSNKQKQYGASKLTQWKADAKAGGAKVRCQTRTKTYKRYIALLDGVIVGFFHEAQVPAFEHAGGSLDLGYAAEHRAMVEQQASAIRNELHRPRIVAVLDVQWGGRRADRWFEINPRNHSGSRLIKMIGHDRFLVTNACAECVGNASGRGKPDATWLGDNLRQLRPEVVLVCGNVAKQTFKRSMVAKDTKVIYMPHPAARTWTKAALAAWTKRIQRHTM
jgi:hypothetical protein